MGKKLLFLKEHGNIFPKEHENIRIIIHKYIKEHCEEEYKYDLMLFDIRELKPNHMDNTRVSELDINLDYINLTNDYFSF